jgi:hypothetical protein
MTDVPEGNREGDTAWWVRPRSPGAAAGVGIHPARFEAPLTFCFVRFRFTNTDECASGIPRYRLGRPGGIR